MHILDGSHLEFNWIHGLGDITTLAERSLLPSLHRVDDKTSLLRLCRFSWFDACRV